MRNLLAIAVLSIFALGTLSAYPLITIRCNYCGEKFDRKVNAAEWFSVPMHCHSRCFWANHRPPGEPQ